jgi:hypothetical protein
MNSSVFCAFVTRLVVSGGFTTALYDLKSTRRW